MKTYSIYGTKYELSPVTDEPVDAYAYKGELVDDEPENGKVVGVVLTEDGSLVQCYVGGSKIPLLASLFIGCLIVTIGAYFLFFRHTDDITIGGTFLQPSVNKDVVTFNGIMSANNGVCSIDFVNGEYEATVEIIGDEVYSEPITLQPGEVLQDIPVFMDTEESVTEVRIRISSEGDVAEFEALVEIPANANPYEHSNTLEGYFQGEVILNENQ